MSRPRTTKNVYFFKAGDETFGGVRLPINYRKYKTLDSVLDDLTSRIPGLPRGVRKLCTSHGRDAVTTIEQLKHMGSYVCTDKLSLRRVPGVDLTKIKGLNELPIPSEFETYYEPQQESVIKKVPKKKKKRLKKKKKVKRKKIEDTQDAEDTRDTTDNSGVSKPKTVASNGNDGKGESPPKTDLADDYPDTGGYAWEQSEATEGLPRSTMDGSPYDEKEEDGNYYDDESPSRNSFRRPKSGNNDSRLVSPVDGELAPLDGKKLTHVQRRRLATNQVDTERYVTPGNDTRSVKSKPNSAAGRKNGSSSAGGSRPRPVDKSEDVISSKMDELLSLSDEPPSKREEFPRRYGRQKTPTNMQTNQFGDIESGNMNPSTRNRLADPVA